jgi:anti-sigma-K factor RskA
MAATVFVARSGRVFAFPTGAPRREWRYVHAVPNTDPDRPSSPLPRWSSQAGFLASALAVFTAGWVGMHSNDWRVMVASAVVAVAASALAARFRLC